MKSRILAAKSPKLTKAAPLGVSYNSKPETVIEILLKVAKEHSDVLKKPKPEVFFGDLATLVLTMAVLTFGANFCLELSDRIMTEESWERLYIKILLKLET